MTKHDTKSHKLPNIVNRGFISDDGLVGISLGIVTALSAMAVVMLAYLYLMSQGWL
jgi:cell division protein FtsL